MKARVQRRPRVAGFGRAVCAAVAAGAVAVPLLAGPAGAGSIANPTALQNEVVRSCGPYKTVPVYPSSISVSGLSGTVSDVNVTLNDFTSADRDPATPGVDAYTEDADILLQAPNGATLVLMSDAGGDNSVETTVTDTDITVDDQAALPIPPDTILPSNAAISGKPTDDDDDPGETLPVDQFHNDLACVPQPGDPPDSYQFAGPAPGAATTLASFNGINPNGTWSLYMVDDFGGPETVALDAGWSIDISTGGGNQATQIGVFRPSTGTWFFHGGAVTQFGTNGDIQVPGDYDGNGTQDIAVFRPSNGFWYVNGGAAVQFGTSGDVPVPADYDGNGTTDIAVFRPSTGFWFVRNGPVAQFGTTGDIPVPGDYNGNGSDEFAVFRPSTGTWFVNGGPVTQFGTNGDIPVPADYNGNGSTDIAVFRPSNGFWFVQGGAAAQFGTSGDIPVPGDYDGNGTASFAVFRPSTGFWFVQGGPVVQFGASGDRPLPLPAAIQNVFFP